MKDETNIFYSIPEVWDFSLENIYDKKEYVDGLIKILDKAGVTEKSLILDAGCGSGFPTLDLIERGYRVVGSDKSSEMVRQIKLNAEKRGVNIEARHVMWADLSKKFDPIFDYVYCRGNSLIYAASWEQNWIVPDRSKEEIEKALKNFATVLKLKGILYVDFPRRDEKPYEKIIGLVRTDYGEIEMKWKVDHDYKSKIRTWTVILKFLETGEIKEYPSYAYWISNEEIVKFLSDAGFKKIEENVKVDGENNYSVYIAHK